ncbi:hypothetical protein [Pontibacillus yanchengensis]|uniref:Uncharacterized protein n=1 Tax=Pontibacillus yanchengensis Y32 TaxID=1385514 RepID=A0A0A2TFP6_9BACI|nr:hypothetical protein [Pontibacillus yanchengensis]KGP72911.1 hypothetical protein N782_09730 [Pontibacillus yanchengensis Y32]
MDKMKLLELSRDINLEYEPGVFHDISNSLDENEWVEEFSYEHVNNKYNVNVKLLNGLNIVTARELFTTFLLSVEYSSTFYVREYTSERVEYTLLSKRSSSNRGFLCEVTFY